VGQILIVGALLIGGLYVSNTLSLIGAKETYNWMKGKSIDFGKWTARKGLQYATAPLRTKGEEEGSKSRAERIQEWAMSRKSGVGRYMAGWIGRGAAELSTAGGEDLVKRHKDDVKKMSLSEKKMALLTASTPREIAILEDLQASQDLDGVDMARYGGLEEKARFARFGRGKQFEDLGKTIGASAEMIDAALKKDTEALTKATDKFVKSLKMDDLKKGQWNDFYSEKPAFGWDKKTATLLADEVSASFAENMPGAFAKITPKVKGKNFDNYKNTVEYQINLFEKAHPERLDKEGKSDARKSFEKNLGWLTLGIASEEFAKPEGA